MSIWNIIRYYEDFNKESVKNLKATSALADAIYKRITCELQYSQALSKITLPFPVEDGEKKTSFIAIAAFVTNCQSRSEQAAKLAEQLKTDVYDPLIKSYRDNETSYKFNSEKCRSTLKEIKDCKEKFNSIESTYQFYQKEADKILQVCEEKKFQNDNKDIKEEGSLKLNIKLNLCIREALASEKTYVESVAKLCNTVNEKKKTLDALMFVIQQQDDARGMVVKDSLRKMLVFQTSVDQNNRYDIQNLSSIYDSINPEVESKQLCSKLLYEGAIEKDIAPKFYLPEARKAQINIFANTKTSYLDYRRYDEKFKDSVMMVNPDFLKLYQELEAKLQNADTPEISNELISYLSNISKLKIGRHALITYITKVHPVELSPNRYKLIAHICLIILDSADEYKDLRSIIKVFEISHKLKLQERGQLLQEALGVHRIWNESLMWEAAIKTQTEHDICMNLHLSANYYDMVDEIKKRLHHNIEKQRR